MEQTFSFGAWLQQRRRALDLTQAELGQCVGCSADHIRNLEADRRRPSKEIAERLLPCLQLPPRSAPPFCALRGVSPRPVCRHRSLNAPFLSLHLSRSITIRNCPCLPLP